MQFTFNCVHCNAQLEAEGKDKGLQLDCPSCNRPLIVPPSKLDKGTLIGGFLIEQRLGAGGMGEVFLARQLSMERLVALKILPVALGQNSDAKERFQSEVRNLARIQHGNIVTAIESGEDDGVRFLAMTFVDGEDLQKRLEREKILEERDALKIVLKVADALKTVWDEYQILHRDIKPSNIMLDKRGDPKVMDLGLSKSMVDNFSLTVTGAALGTPHYISPEQALNRTVLDFRSDIYSLGATLYHLVTGTVPYNGSSAAAIMLQHVNEPFPMPQERNPLLSDACSHLIETMMAKLPEHRQSSWGALLEDIERILAGLPPLTMRPGLGQSVVDGRFSDADQIGALRKSRPDRRSVKDVVRWVVYTSMAGLMLLLFILFFMPHITSGRGDQAVKSASAQKPPEAMSITARTPDEQMHAPAYPPVVIPADVSAPAGDSQNPGADELQLFMQISNWVKENPHAWDEGIAKFEKLMRESRTMRSRQRIMDEIRRLGQEKNLAVNSKLAELSAAATVVFNQGDHAQAVAMLRNYTGVLADLTAVGREDHAARLEKSATEKQTATELLDRQLLTAMNMSAAKAVLAGELQNALEIITQGQDKIRSTEHVNELNGLKTQLYELLKIQEGIMASFMANKNRAQEVEFKDGTEQVVVRNVEGLTVSALRVTKHGSSTIRLSRNFTYADLSVNERLKRLKDANSADAFVLKGLMALERREISAARRFFVDSSSNLGRVLIEYFNAVASTSETATGQSLPK